MAIVGVRIDMAIGARKFYKIGRIHVAIRAFNPLPLVFSAINREKLRIVLGV